ncbi:MAG TPA: hypothetical protein PLQ76_05990, partial [bacterium]|nr:hypothetical protein [bacterium]
MFQKNLNLLRDRFPDAYDAIASVGRIDSDGIEFFSARNGEACARVGAGGSTKKTIHSSIAPSKEAAKILDTLGHSGDRPLVFLGAGLGYTLFEAAIRFPRSPIAVFEARPFLLVKSLELFDWETLLKRDAFFISTSYSFDIGEIPEIFFDTPTIVQHQPLFKIDIDHYFPIIKMLNGKTLSKNKLRILSFASRGNVLPYTLMDIQEALRSLGHEVFAADISGIHRDTEMSDAVWKAVSDFQPDFVVTMDAVGLREESIGRLGIPVAAWFFDDPFGYLKFKGEEHVGVSPELMGDDFHIFTWDEHYVKLLLEKDVSAHYLPMSSNPNVYKPMKSIA